MIGPLPKIAGSALALSAIILLAGRASAECVVEDEATEASTCVVMPRGAARGVWFELEVADQLSREHVEVAIRRQQVDVLEEAARVRNAQLLLLREAARQYDQSLQQARRERDAARKKYDAARREQRRWYRHPVFWFSAGVASTLGAGAGFAWRLL